MCRKRDLFKIWRHSWKVQNGKKYCETEENTKRIVSTVMCQTAPGEMEKFDSCRNVYDSFKSCKQRPGEKRHVIRVTCLKDERLVWIIKSKSWRNRIKDWWTLEISGGTTLLLRWQVKCAKLMLRKCNVQWIIWKMEKQISYLGYLRNVNIWWGILF